MKLTKTLRGRLEEIYQGRYIHENIAKVSTKRLEELGLIEVRGRKVSVTGRLVWAGNCYLTDAGRAALGL